MLMKRKRPSNRCNPIGKFSHQIIHRKGKSNDYCLAFGFGLANLYFLYHAYLEYFFFSVWATGEPAFALAKMSSLEDSTLVEALSPRDDFRLLSLEPAVWPEAGVLHKSSESSAIPPPADPSKLDLRPLLKA